MINSESKTPFAGRTVLISPSVSSEFTTELQRLGGRVFTWPKLDVRPLDNYDPLDESIENLFGYDWLVFQNVNAVDFFLRRFRERGHEISELDGLRVCGAGGGAINKLESSQVHVDVIPVPPSAQAVFGAIAIYAGGSDHLRGLNFLIPNADTAIDYLSVALQDAGARVDSVATYRTCPADNAALARIHSLIMGGAVDCVAFTTSAEVRDLSVVFDTHDLGRLLRNIAIACMDETCVPTIAEFGLTADIVSAEASLQRLAQAVVSPVVPTK
jgi:uroporphyrinogen III methyltransferase / synthase